MSEQVSQPSIQSSNQSGNQSRNELVAQQTLEPRRVAFNQAMSQVPQDLIAKVRQAKNGQAEDVDGVCAAMAWAAYACPEAITPIYDQIMGAWLEDETLMRASAVNLAELPHTVVHERLYKAFWAVIDDADKGYDATSITLRAAALSHYVDPEYLSLAENAAAMHPGCRDASSRAVPTLYSIQDLADLSASWPKESLAASLHKMWVDNGFDPEVLDREVIGLANLPPNLCYLNTRILQMHDVWHLVAGYETTALHEIAISAFQLAQFGHNYSAMFLAVVMMMIHYRQGEAWAVFMQEIALAWQHGRQSPALMDIDWDGEWHKNIAELRQTYQIRAFQSDMPADLLESLQPEA